MVDFEDKLKEDVAKTLERQVIQVCPKYYKMYIKVFLREREKLKYTDMMSYYNLLTPSQKKKVKTSERMFIEDTIAFYETEIKRFDGMNKIYEDKFAKYIVLSFV